MKGLEHVLIRFNRLATVVERMGSGHRALEQTLHQIVESAVEVLPIRGAFLHPFDLPQPVYAPTTLSPHEFPSRETLFSEQGEGTGWGIAALREGRPVDRRTPYGLVSWYPLMVEERPLGLLGLMWQVNVSPTREHRLIAEGLAHLATLALQRSHLRRPREPRAQRRWEGLERLRRAGMLISSRYRLEDTLEAILQMALEVTQARYGILRLVDAGGMNLVTKAIAGERLSRPAVESLPIDTTTITGWVATHRQPLRIDDVRLSPWSRIYYPLDYDLEMRSELAVPLIGANDRLEGVINLESPRVAAFSEEDSQLLQALATQAVIAIQEARLLDALQDIAWRVLTESLEPVLKHIIRWALQLLDGQAAAIWLLEGDTLVLAAHSQDHPAGARVPLRGSLAGAAVRARGPVASADVRVDPRFYRPELARNQGWGAALVVPLLAGDTAKPVGAFTLYAAETEQVDFEKADWAKKVLTILAHYAALAVHNARRQAELQAAQEQHAIAETFAALGDVAANVLHHLNNKVGTIPVRVEAIQEKYAKLLEQEPYLSRSLAAIQNSAREALQEVRDSLALLRPIRRGPVHVQECVEEALKAVEPPPSVRVHLSVLDELPPVLAGRQSLTFVFVNLFQNALEAMDGRGQLDIYGRTEKEHVVVYVRDSGPGIPGELQERIFDFAVSPRQGQNAHKLGFGLWWVKTLMTRLGGEVRVESRPGRGTTFVLRLPVAQRTKDGQAEA